MLDLNLVEKVEQAPLRSHPSEPKLFYSEKSDYKPPYPFSEGRGWVYSDLITGKIDYPINVYDNGTLVDPSDYIIYWTNCAIKFSDAYTIQSPDNITVDFWYYYVALISEFPDAPLSWEESLNKISNTIVPNLGINSPTYSNIAIPIAALTVDTTFSKPLQIGGGEIIRHACFLDVFATNGVERNVIGEGLRSKTASNHVPAIDFSLAFPLSDDGTFNTSYNSTDQKIGRIYVENPILTKIKLNNPVEVDKYRMQLSFDAVSYGF